MEFLEPDLNCSDSEAEAPVIEQKCLEGKGSDSFKKEKKAKKSIFESGDISSFSPAELAGLFDKHLRKAYPSLTDLEFDAFHFPGIIIVRMGVS